jgi:hypothetical protein
VLGRFLFRWRGVIGFVAFGLVFWLARPTFGSCLLGLPIIIVGLAVRFWASGYIGIEGRAREIGASRRIVSGPYRVLRHPLYIGNFLLVAGMLVALRPAVWLGMVVLAGFLAEYGFIVAAEEADLARGRSQKVDAGPERAAPPGEISRLVGLARNDRTARRVERGRRQKAEVRIGGPAPPSMVHGLESRDEKLGTVNGENRGQSLGAPASNSARYSPRFPRPCEGTVPVFRHGPESFLLSRALVEWRTWVVSGVAWGLALVKAAIVS